MLEAASIAAHIRASLAAAAPRATPYRHWLPQAILPVPVLDALDALPLVPPAIADTAGRRETHNAARQFFGMAERASFPVYDALAHALQSPETTAALAAHCGARLRGTSLRIEYCLDTDGFWLEPHTDIGAKLFTMLIYLADPPPGEAWGTDLYASPTQHVGTAPCARNQGLIFIPGPDTWHGFERRRITGTRRSLIVNYVTSEWRARHELAFPQQAVS